MLSTDELIHLAQSRWKEAHVLLDHKKHDGALYLAGYALELMLKRQIALRLKWSNGYPTSKKEFENLQTFKTHNLDVLLQLSGLERQIKGDDALLAYWQRASTWNSEIRYRILGSIDSAETGNIIEATKYLLNYINREA